MKDETEPKNNDRQEEGVSDFHKEHERGTALDVATKPAGDKSRLKWIIIIAVVVLAIAGGAFYLGQRSGDKDADTQKDVPATPTASAGQEAKALNDQMDKLYAKQDYAGAVKLAEAQTAKNRNPQMLLILAGAYTNNKQYTKAFAIYDELDSKGQLSGADTMNAGEVAQLAGDKAKALGYFQKAKTKLIDEPHDQYSQRQVQFVDEQITELQK